MKETKIHALFVDIGGVLLTNGWEKKYRQMAAEKFNYDFEESESRHRMAFDTYELGKMTLKEYLTLMVFYKDRDFHMKDYIDFMYRQSQPLPNMIELISSLKRQYNLKVVAVSNEGRELTEYRIEKFNLGSFIDFFVSSCFIQLKKPDKQIYHRALDLSQVKPIEVVYIEDRNMFTEVAGSMGFNTILHKDYPATREKLASHGLCLENKFTTI